ncbi:MAG TPA: histidine ammonia-lyase [Candidatus Wujingus californicus]|uniref:histidine ammonia-lyase n=1 Tax=Candidatus Wujingus californicus TaxID=3367618 RepID=UPI001D58A2CD|nr:histidine ammonia-lyase [Planctomycetota bacterium]MDO8132339.1 histidine ammonia-lyase [Candidatus Brocadiales bacterium]
MEHIVLDGNSLTLDQFIKGVRNGNHILLSEDAEKRVINARRMIADALNSKRIIYGLTTGFGALSDVVISEEQTKLLQKNILMSHAAGIGNYLDVEITKGVLILKINNLAKGYSGIKPDTLKTLIELFNKGVYPLMPEKGSVGASGDLAPLAHLALVLIGQGKAFYNGDILNGKDAMESTGINLVDLDAGEGLALINGTQVMTAIGAITVYDAMNLLKTADIAAGMSLEVLLASNIELDKKIHEVRPHPGQIISADNLRRITRNSEIVSSHKDCSRIQDAYSIRCSPQVHGASVDALHYARRVIEIEMNSATDNPLVFPETNQIISGGNFHGQPIALALDFLTIALSEIANISERRIERLVNPQLSGLPAFLIKDVGLNSGFMIAQYTAAALVSENKVLAHPASVDSIPTSANKEDHVSMGTISARKCREVLKNAEFVISIELLCAAQAMDLFTNLKAGAGTVEAYKLIRKHISHMEEDRVLSDDINTMYKLVHEGKIRDAVENKIGQLN